jgi:hypothetical protein
MIDYSNIPEYAPALRKLLKGSLSRDHDTEQWEIMLRNRSFVESWLEKIGLLLFLDEVEGYAFLQDPEPPEDYAGPALPKMMIDRALDYRSTLLCVLLRERLRVHDEKALEIGRPMVSKTDLYEELAPFFSKDSDQMKFRQDVDRSIGTIVKMKLLREVNGQNDTYYIERIIKARISADALEEIKEKLTQAQNEPEDELTV